MPRWRDIKDVTAESVKEKGITDITLVSGGVPCQPASVAGKRRGAKDDRWLWPEAIRIIREIRPTWCILENVGGLATLNGGLEFEGLLFDLENQGYEVQSFNIPACAVDAPHRRARIFIVAYAVNRGPQERRAKTLGILSKEPTNRETDSDVGTEIKKPSIGFRDVPDPDGEQSRRVQFAELSANVRTGCENVSGPSCELFDGGRKTRSGGIEPANSYWRTVKSGLGRVANEFSHWLDEPVGIPRIATGIKNRVNRLKCLGNAVVPAQVYPILKFIAEIELQNESEA